MLRDMKTRKDYTGSSMNLTKLDLSCLPIETKFRVGFLELDHTKTLVANDDVGETMMFMAGLRSPSGTLRQVKYYDAGTSRGHPRAVAEVKLGVQQKHRPILRLDGTNSNLWMRARDIGSGSAGFDVMAEKENAASITRGVFIPQHTIHFPATFYGRGNVSFLGLPRGTIVPLKNGGVFEVSCRTNVIVESDSSATGHLHLVPKDDKAEKLAQKMGWGSQHLLGVTGYLVPPNLYTGGRNGNSFETESIRIPYRDPTEDCRAIILDEVLMKYPANLDMAHRVNGGQRTTWADSPEQLAASLDDFLFG